MTPLPRVVGWITDKEDTEYKNKRLVNLEEFEEDVSGDYVLVVSDGDGASKHLLKKKK